MVILKLTVLLILILITNNLFLEGLMFNECLFSLQHFTSSILFNHVLCLYFLHSFLLPRVSLHPFFFKKKNSFYRNEIFIRKSPCNCIVPLAISSCLNLPYKVQPLFPVYHQFIVFAAFGRRSREHFSSIIVVDTSRVWEMKKKVKSYYYPLAFTLGLP